MGAKHLHPHRTTFKNTANNPGGTAVQGPMGLVSASLGLGGVGDDLNEDQGMEDQADGVEDEGSEDHGVRATEPRKK